MTKFKPYLAYKDSGDLRLGVIPEHWDLLSCRAIVDECTDKNSSGNITEYLSLLANIGIIKYEDKGDIGNKKPDDLSKCKIVKKGNLVINSMNYGIGSFGLSSLNGVCSPVYIVLDPKDDVIQERFALRIFEEKEFQAFAQSFGNGILAHRSAIKWDDLKNIPIALPPIPEQILLTRFLDHETTRIDALIHEQQRLIELLKEKRQAVISHAVTKGLDPTAPMKDSGVEWLGEVPAHWDTGYFRHLIKSISNGTTVEQVEEDDDTIAISRIETISNGEINFEKTGHVKTYNAATRFLLNYGDILFSHINSLAMIGNIAIYNNERPLLHGMNLLRIQPESNIASKWVFYWLKSQNIRQEVESKAKPAINQASISIDSVKALPALIPPFSEQIQIANFLDQTIIHINTLISEVLTGIALLQERRSALISAAVTGKIDVRDWQPPASSDTIQTSERSKTPVPDVAEVV